MNSNGPGGTSGAHTTCCEERPVFLRVPSPAPGALLARLTVPAVATPFCCIGTSWLKIYMQHYSTQKNVKV